MMNCAGFFPHIEVHSVCFSEDKIAQKLPSHKKGVKEIFFLLSGIESNGSLLLGFHEH